MKRLLILLTVLCLSLLSCPALCSGEESYLCTDSDALEMDDFSIVLPKGTRYELTEKVYEDVFLTVYPDSATGGVRENFQVSWYGHPLTGDVQSVAREWVRMDAEALQYMKEMGLRVLYFRSHDAREAVMAGERCIIIDHTSKVGLSEISQRTVYFLDRGYDITLTAYGKDRLERMYDMLDQSLIWS